MACNPGLYLKLHCVRFAWRFASDLFRHGSWKFSQCRSSPAQLLNSYLVHVVEVLQLAVAPAAQWLMLVQTVKM
jgi:hypothetical protein